MKFHQSILSDSDKEAVIRFLDEKASPEGKTILARYVPDLSDTHGR
jgi:hypothetical protein